MPRSLQDAGSRRARPLRFEPVLWVVLAVLALRAGAAEPAAPVPTGPLAFPALSRHFAPPLAARQVEAEFAFTNTGATAVGIVSTSTSCGCTTASLSKAVFAPGESGSITATFVVGDRTGPQRKVVHVRTDSPRQPVVDLAILVDLPEGPLVSPAISYWRIGEPPVPRAIDAVLPPGSPFRFTAAALTAQAASTFTLDARIAADGSAVSMRVAPRLTTVGVGAAIDLQAVAIADPTVVRTFRAFMCVTDQVPASADPLPDPTPPAH